MMQRKGFSLIELMVVVAIIGFLAMIAVPNFMRYLAKSKRTEAYVNLRAIYGAEKTYYAEHGRYTDLLHGAGSAGWRPEGYKGGGANEAFYYTYGIGGGSGGEGGSYFTGKLNTPQSHLSAGRADDRGFVAVAAGSINGDGKVDVLTVDETGEIKIVQDALA